MSPMSAKMNCWYCHSELIHRGDHDIDTAVGIGIESNLHCPNCGAEVMILKMEDE